MEAALASMSLDVGGSELVYLLDAASNVSSSNSHVLCSSYTHLVCSCG